MVFLFLLFKIHFAFADQPCWQNEIDPSTDHIFGSETSYNEAVRFWNKQRPSVPSLASLGIAYFVYRTELPEALKLSYDKREHCYLGCRIAQGTSVLTATYVGWRKEEDDLNDCSLTTDYDPRDFAATKLGAAASHYIDNSQIACAQYCIEKLPLPKEF